MATEAGPHDLPPSHSPAWRMMRAKQICKAGFDQAVIYLRQMNDPAPEHTAAQAVWQVAIERTAAAMAGANDNVERIGEDDSD